MNDLLVRTKTLAGSFVTKTFVVVTFLTGLVEVLQPYQDVPHVGTVLHYLTIGITVLVGAANVVRNVIPVVGDPDLVGLKPMSSATVAVGDFFEDEDEFWGTDV